jgi:hypothetical protein
MKSKIKLYIKIIKLSIPNDKANVKCFNKRLVTTIWNVEIILMNQLKI